MTSWTKKKSKKDKDLPVIAPSRAEIVFAQDGLLAVLPETSKNLYLLLRDMKRTGKFNVEFSYSMREEESLDDLAKQIERSICSGSKAEVHHDPANLPILPRFPTFREFCLKRTLKKSGV